jgi:hypothetical protein
VKRPEVVVYGFYVCGDLRRVDDGSAEFRRGVLSVVDVGLDFLGDCGYRASLGSFGFPSSCVGLRSLLAALRRDGLLLRRSERSGRRFPWVPSWFGRTRVGVRPLCVVFRDWRLSSPDQSWLGGGAASVFDGYDFLF